MKTKQTNAKKLTDMSLLFYSSIHFLSSQAILQLRKANVKISILFSFFVLSPSRITKKLYGVCKYCTHRMAVLLLKILLIWLGAACELQPASYELKTVSKHASHSHWALLGLLLRNLGVRCVVRPHPHYWTCGLLATNCE